MKFLIVGRTSCGKDYFAKKLKDRGFTFVKSYTTREPRTQDEDTHIFINPDEASDYTDRVAEHKIGNIEYFATREQVENADVYVINPDAIPQLANNMPETTFCVIHIMAPKDIAREKAIERAFDKDKAGELFDKRTEKEDAEFIAFETKAETISKTRDVKDLELPSNVIRYYPVQNDFTDGTLSLWSEIMLRHKRKQKCMYALIKSSVEELGIMQAGEQDDTVKVAFENETKSVSYDVFADTLISNPEGLAALMGAILEVADINLLPYPKPKELQSE